MAQIVSVGCAQPAPFPPAETDILAPEPGGVWPAVSNGGKRIAFSTGSIVAAVIALLISVAPVSVAQLPPALAPQATESQTIGFARAVAGVSRFGPGVGSLNFEMRQNTAIARVINKVAEAQAQAFDAGGLGIASTVQSCTVPAVPQEALPTATTVDNRNGDAEESQVKYGGSPEAGSGVESVRATIQPLAEATATANGSNLGPVFTLNNGQANAIAEVIDGGHRAAASAEASVTIAGVLTLDNMRWEATHSHRPDPIATGSFSVGNAAGVGGTQIPADESALNAQLAGTGMSIEFPEVVKLGDRDEIVRVTPMVIKVQDSPAGAATVGTLAGLTNEQKVALFQTMIDTLCETGIGLVVADVGISIASGSGFLRVEIGGIEVTTSATEATDPFAFVPSVPLPAPIPVAPTLTPSPTGSPARGVASGPAGAPAAGNTPAAPQPSTPSAGLITQIVDEYCESVHPFNWPDCSHGTPILLGVVGLGAVGVMAALDRRSLASRESPIS